MKIQPDKTAGGKLLPRKQHTSEPDFRFERLAGAICEWPPRPPAKRRRKLPAGKKLLIDSTVWLSAGTRQWGNWFRRLKEYAPLREWVLLLDYRVYDELQELLDSEPHHVAATLALELIEDFRTALSPLGLFKELPRQDNEQAPDYWTHTMSVLVEEKDSLLITRSACIPEPELEMLNADQYIHYAENYVPIIR